MEPQPKGGNGSALSLPLAPPSPSTDGPIAQMEPKSKKDLLPPQQAGHRKAPQTTKPVGLRVLSAPRASRGEDPLVTGGGWLPTRVGERPFREALGQQSVWDASTPGVTCQVTCVLHPAEVQRPGGRQDDAFHTQKSFSMGSARVRRAAGEGTRIRPTAHRLCPGARAGRTPQAAPY